MPELSQIFAWLQTLLSYQLFALNHTPVTLASLLMFAFVLGSFYLVSKFVSHRLLGRFLRRFNIDQGTRFTFQRITHYLFMIVGALVAFQFVGIDLSGLAVIFGLLSVGIGFGLQNVTSNFIAGLILLFERPIQVGDRVTVADKEGDVESINIRSTTIRTPDNIFVIVPNSEFVANAVINWSHMDPKIRISVEVGVSYNSDLDLVLETLMEVAEEHPDVLKKPAPEVLLNSFGDSAWNMVLRVWIADPKKYPVIVSELHCAIVRKFRQVGIEIPFPQRDINFRGPLITTSGAES
ncbi:MAG: mechanosensitive ion channel family protein [Calditrichaeota bacterium]|nr:MAG: mechanosensitive ion channel family protein [Calditrichota bacterium]